MKRKSARVAAAPPISGALGDLAAAAKALQLASARGQAVLDGVQAEHAIVEAAKAQAAAIVNPARERFEEAQRKLLADIAPFPAT